MQGKDTGGYRKLKQTRRRRKQERHIKSNFSFLQSFFKNSKSWGRACCSENVRMRTRNTRDNRKKNLGTSTYRRGARAACHDEYPQDFGPRIAYTVSLVSDTSRPPIWQGGREMSAPRPYGTNPFHQPALFTPFT